MKKFCCIILVVALLASSVLTVGAVTYRESMMDPYRELTEALSGRAVFMPINNTAFINNTKLCLTDASMQFLTSGSSVMIPEKLFEMYSGRTVSFDASTGYIDLDNGESMYIGSNNCTTSNGVVTFGIAPVLKNGILYLPLRDICTHLLGKKVTWDNRGFAVVGDSEITLQNNYKFIDKYYQWHPIDLIYRYMLFDNPTGDEIINTVKLNHPGNAHPRILYTNDDITYIKDKIFNQKDSQWVSAYEELINKANGYVNENLTRYYNNDATVDDRGHCVWYCQTAMECLASAYLISDNKTYASKICEMLRGFTTEGTAWKDGLGYSGDHLIIGHWSAIIAIGYDACYNYMQTTYDGQLLCRSIKQHMLSTNIFADHMAAYKSYAPEKSPMWRSINDNFIGVIGGGFMALLLAVCDESDFNTTSAYLLENVLRSLYIAAELYYPNGGYYEGVAYSEYMLQNLTISINALFNCCNTDYSIGKAPGFTDCGDFFTYMQTPQAAFPFHDSVNGSYYNNDIREFFAYRYNRPEGAVAAINQKKLGGHSISLRSLFFSTRALENTSQDISVSSLPLDKYFYGTEAGAMFSSFGSSTPSFVGVHGGKTGISHDSLDLGQFVFVTDGIAWADDLGRDSYKDNYHTTYNHYRKRSEGENCIVINPALDYDGQEKGVWTALVREELNSPAGAILAYDLTDAYSRDVSKYHRGYLFGDNRTTLTVRDEITLTKDNSELYWFMHTKANIEIVSNTQAKLTMDGKTCMVDVICSDNSFTLKKMEPKPLSTSPTVESNNANEGYSKLALHSASVPKGDVTITVKLSPQHGYSYAPITNAPISTWTVGETQKNFTVDYDSVQGNYWTPTTIQKCVGPDGKANTAFKLTSSQDSQSVYFYGKNGADNLNIYGAIVALEAYVKRDEGQNINISIYEPAQKKYTSFTNMKDVVAADGKICGTNVIMPPNKWAKLRIETNLATKESAVYYNARLVYRGVNTNQGAPYGIGDTLAYFNIASWCPTSSGGIYFGDISIHIIEDIGKCDTISAPVVTRNGKEVSAGITVFKQSLDSILPGSATFIVAEYQDDNLLSINFVSKNLSANRKNDFTVPLTCKADNSTIKTFLWDSLSDCIPLLPTD